jgi:hypothetical protein
MLADWISDNAGARRPRPPSAFPGGMFPMPNCGAGRAHCLGAGGIRSAARRLRCPSSASTARKCWRCCLPARAWARCSCRSTGAWRARAQADAAGLPAQGADRRVRLLAQTRSIGETLAGIHLVASPSAPTSGWQAWNDFLAPARTPPARPGRRAANAAADLLHLGLHRQAQGRAADPARDRSQCRQQRGHARPERPTT